MKNFQLPEKSSSQKVALGRANIPLFHHSIWLTKHDGRKKDNNSAAAAG